MEQLDFGEEGRYVKLDHKKDPLVKLNAIIPWELFRPRLRQVWREPERKRKSPAGRKPWDEIVMFKALILCALYNLSDDQDVLQSFFGTQFDINAVKQWPHTFRTGIKRNCL